MWLLPRHCQGKAAAVHSMTVVTNAREIRSGQLHARLHVMEDAQHRMCEGRPLGATVT